MNDCRGNLLWLPWGWAAPGGLLAAVDTKNLYSRALYLWLLISLSSLIVSREGIKFSGSVRFRFLTALDQDVEIVIKRKPRSWRQARVSVIAA
jgi:hypothetical protein